MNALTPQWDPVRAGKEIDAVWEKRQHAERKLTDIDDTLLKMLLDAKEHYDGTFKHFVETYTHISLTTAKRTLRIADGRGEEVRAAERARQQKSRAAKGVTANVTPSTSPPVDERTENLLKHVRSPFERSLIVARAADEVNKQGRPVDMLVDDGAAVRVEPEVVTLVPEPVEQFPVLDFTFAGKRLSDIDRLFPGVDEHDCKTPIRFDDDNIDLELYDMLERVAEKVRIIAQSLRDVPVIEEAIHARWKAEHEADKAERRQKAEAAEAARLARIEWEITHADKARKAYYAEALAKAKDDRDFENDEREFDQAAFDAAYKPGADGAVCYGNPEKEFFERWRKEHHTIWPGHLEAEPVHVDRFDGHKQRTRRMKQLMASVNLDHITDMKKARRLYDAADHHHDFEAMCVLADFMKIERPKCASPSLECDHKVDPADVGCQDRYDAFDAWEQQNGTYIAAKAVLSDKLWRHEEPKEAAADDRERAKRDAQTKKRLIAEAKSPAKAKAKALKDAERDAMDGDMDEAKEDARESGERWGDMKEQWIADWKENNWDEDAQAEAEAEFLEDWEFAHGKPFPASKYGKGQGARAVDG